METWRIAIPIVVFIVYPKTGHKYMPLYRCRMKNPVSGEWFNALIYQGMENGEEYKDSFDKFVKLLDWENETKESGQC